MPPVPPLDVQHRQPQLVPDRRHDRLPPRRPPTSKWAALPRAGRTPGTGRWARTSGTAPPRPPREDRTGSRIGRVIDAQVDAGDAEREQRDADHPLGDRPRPSGHDQGVGQRDNQDGEARQGPRQASSTPASPRGSGRRAVEETGDDNGGVIGHDLGRDDGPEEHEQVPPPPDHDQAEDHAPPDQADRPGGREPLTTSIARRVRCRRW